MILPPSIWQSHMVLRLIHLSMQKSTGVIILNYRADITRA